MSILNEVGERDAWRCWPAPTVRESGTPYRGQGRPLIGLQSESRYRNAD